MTNEELTDHLAGKYGHLSSASIWGRIKLAWNILRNRPTGYRLEIDPKKGIHYKTMLWNSTLRNFEAGIAVPIESVRYSHELRAADEVRDPDRALEPGET